MSTQVLGLIQVVGEVALFGDHRTKPETAFSVPRSEWEVNGTPLTITVTVEPGGKFEPRETHEDANFKTALQGMTATIDKPGGYL